MLSQRVGHVGGENRLPMQEQQVGKGDRPVKIHVPRTAAKNAIRDGKGKGNG